MRQPNLVPCYNARQEQPSVLEPFRPYLLERIDAADPNWIPATVLLREIKLRGNECGYSTLTGFLRLYKPKHEPDPLVRFETEPGVQMQVDFTTISYRGKRIKAFVATLGYSWGSFVSYHIAKNKNTGYEGLKKPVNTLGTLPKKYCLITLKPSCSNVMRMEKVPTNGIARCSNLQNGSDLLLALAAPIEPKPKAKSSALMPN